MGLLSVLTVGPIWGGIIAGVLHAMLGPDHLSTIVTLSVFQGSKAFWFGVRWASGHVGGLFTIGIALTFLSSRYNQAFNTYEHYADYFIGCLLMMFGGYFLWCMDRNLDFDGNLKPSSFKCCHGNAGDTTEALLNCDPEDGTSECKAVTGRFLIGTTIIRRKSAAIMGFIQGVACPAGLVGIVFLKQYVHSLAETLIFIGVFFVVTAMAMGCLSMAYGVLTERCISSARLAFGIYSTSCLFSLVLGATWIVLAASGSLDVGEGKQH